MIEIISNSLIGLSAIGFLAAIYFAFQLSQETRAGRYWVAFLIAAIGLGTHQWMKLVHVFYPVSHELQQICIELGILVGASSMAYGLYGIQQSVKQVKTKTED